jgi:hypothetical protein
MGRERKPMNIKLWTMVAALLLSLTGLAFSTPSTQIWVPSTDVQAFKVVHFGFDMFIKTSRQTSGVREPSVINNGLTVGVLPFSEVQMEVGLDQRVVGFDGYDTYPLYFNAKVGLPEDGIFKGFPAIALGGFDIGTRKNVTNFNVLYGVVAKTLPVVGRLSVGYFTGNEKLLLGRDGGKDNAGLIASWDRTISEVSDKLWLCVDYMGTKSGYGALSAGLAWKFADNVGVIGAMNFWNNTDYRPTATLQVDIDLK